MNQEWYKTNPPHLVAVGQGAEAYIQAERVRLEEAGQHILNLTPESVGNLSNQASDLWPEPLFVVACGTITKMVSELCELIAKQGRASHIHLLAAYPDIGDVPPVLQANARVFYARRGSPTFHQYAHGAVTAEIKQKLITMIEQRSSDGYIELLAEDIIELMAVARRDKNGFRAVNKALDELLEAYTESGGT